MTCPRCGGTMEERRVRFCVCDINPPLMIESVPAYVCTTCGEEIFSDATTAVFERIRDGEIPQSRSETLRVYDFAAAASYQGESPAAANTTSVYGLYAGRLYAGTGTAHPITLVTV